MKLLVVIALASELIAVWCAVGLWHARMPVLRKLMWTVVLLVPVVVRYFTVACSGLPSVQLEGFRSTNEWDGPLHEEGPGD